MKRNTLLILSAGFGSSCWLGGLFERVEMYQSLKQITPQSVLVFEGGVDIAPSIYGQKPNFYTQHPNYHRDMLERSAFRKAVSRGAGIIGICRGAQLSCALSGGSLIQHVTRHTQDHWIATKDGHNFITTSCHHQMMYPFDLPDDEYELLGWSSDDKARPQAHSSVYLGEGDETDRIPDREPEVVWFPKTRSIAIQGHPEWARPDGIYQTYCRTIIKKHLLSTEAA